MIAAWAICVVGWIYVFSLPDNVDTGNIQAETRDGMLTVHLPKLSYNFV